MATIWRDADLSLEPLSGRSIAVLGFGSQGRAQALNLQDSGQKVVVGLRDGSPSRAEAASMGLAALSMQAAVAAADVIALLTPESTHAEIVTTLVNPFATRGAALVFAHGYTITYGSFEIREDLQLLLVAPKAIGPKLRRLFEAGAGAPCMVAAERGGLEIAKAYAKALGSGRCAVVLSTFREETETDLFGEQAVLCGGLPELADAAFTTLVEAGYAPEAAYFECLFEIKLIADMMFERGIAGMAARISETAQFGALKAGKTVIGEQSRAAMRRLLEDIRSGEFAREWERERAAGMPAVRSWRDELRSRPLQRTHEELGPMPRLEPPKT